jgi:hypothetical protein
MRAAFSVAIWIGTTLGAAALESGAQLVVPGRPGVPIIINGRDVSFAVIEGDWGLARGNHVQPTVYGGRYINPVPNVGHYYPGASELPGYGRLEIEPPEDRKLPKPAESFHQSWSAQSNPPAPQAEVPFYPPPVILAPEQPLPRPNFRRPRN